MASKPFVFSRHYHICSCNSFEILCMSSLAVCKNGPLASLSAYEYIVWILRKAPGALVEKDKILISRGSLYCSRNRHSRQNNILPDKISCAFCHYLNQCWPSSPTHICGTRGNWVNVCSNADNTNLHGKTHIIFDHFVHIAFLTCYVHWLLEANTISEIAGKEILNHYPFLTSDLIV